MWKMHKTLTHQLEKYQTNVFDRDWKFFSPIKYIFNFLFNYVHQNLKYRNKEKIILTFECHQKRMRNIF